MNDEEKLEKYIEFENSLTIYDDNKVLSELEKLKKERNQKIEELESKVKVMQDGLNKIKEADEEAAEIEKTAQEFWLNDRKGAQRFLKEFRKGLREYQMRVKE
ncbi:MAG: hypothetical protein IIA83_06430 [Thaumarchaeota archaeon]|nr:hypothetical protein [Nitrososphaerota archaeon]